MVEITVGWCRQLEGTEADVVQSLVVDAVGLIGVLDELVDGECRVVWLDNGVGYLTNEQTVISRPRNELTCKCL